MSYVYEKVAKDLNSRQTPHFGFIDGDGDFIFRASIIETLTEDKEEDKDILIETPPTISISTNSNDQKSIIEIVKEYIPDSRFRIRLDDLVTIEIRKILSLTTNEHFPVQTSGVTTDDFIDRLNSYESIIKDIQSIFVLLAHWGTDEHRTVLRKILERIVDNTQVSGGKVIWLSLRFYPSLLLLYSGGIAAISSGNYKNLYTILNTKIGSKYSGDKSIEIIKTVVEEALELERTNIFKTLPGYERNYVPKSEYLLKVLQPVIDDLLFLGNSYETMFDRFEIFLALVYADIDNRELGNLWGPPGRFAYKHGSRSREGGPYAEIIKEAKTYGENWDPLKVGFFGGSYERFVEISSEYEKGISRLGWF